MTGIDIIGALLLRSGPLIAVAPAEQIKAGRLPENAALPAFLVRTVSVVDRVVLKQGSMRRSAARIRVTVRAGSYDDQLEGIRLARDACLDFIGNIAGAERVSVLPAGTGPDINGPASTFEQSQDFRVSFDAPARN